jgi:hypothetical protein
MRISKETQTRLKRVKGEQSYDKLIGFLIKCDEVHRKNIEKIIIDYLMENKQ